MDHKQAIEESLIRNGLNTNTWRLAEGLPLLEEKDNKSKQLKHKFLELVNSRNKDIAKATEILTEYIESVLHIYTTKDDNKSEVWIYKDGIYIPQGKSEIKEILRNILEEQYNQYYYGLVMHKIEADTFIEIERFFENKYVEEIPVKNGILNVLTQELTEFTPNKIFFSKLPVEFDILAKCPNIDKFLKDVLANEEDRKVYYEMAGFGLLKEYRFEKALMMHGLGRNGKGKSIDLLKHLVGPENCCSVPLTSLKTESFAISELFGKLFNLAGDIGHNDLRETNTFKSTTGRDILAGNRKFLKTLFFTNYAKFVFACNELPMVYDMSRGFWDRWILLDFPYTFVTQEEYDKTDDKLLLKIRDDNIIQKLTTPEELSGFLNEALAGLRRLIDNKKFSTTKGSEDVKNTWVRKSNSFMAFCFENIEEDYEGKILKKDLRKRYVDFCKTHKLITKSEVIQKRVLQETYGASETRSEAGEWERQQYIWEGIKWKN